MTKRTMPARTFEPGKIGSLEIRNRILRMGANVMPRTSGDSDENVISPKLIHFYESLAKGGAGAVSVSGGMVKLEDQSNVPGFNPSTDECIPALTEVADAIHKHGAVAFFQMLSPYPDVPVGELSGGNLSLAASSLTQEDLNGLIPFFVPPREIAKEEIDRLVRLYAEMAKRAQKAGFDGVEVNSGHVHFLNTFLSPAWNHRTDEYGGDARGRSKIVCDIIRAIKQECGEDFAVINLITVEEFNLPSGITVADSVEVAKCLEEAGSDALHCRIEVYHDAVPDITVRSGHEVPDVDLYPSWVDKNLLSHGIDNSFGEGVAAWSAGAAEIKKHVNIPIICVGRMDAYVADELIRDGKVDFVNVNRRFIADSDYALKIKEGRFDDVRPCVGCLTCYDVSERGLPAFCMVNAGMLQGEEYNDIKKADRRKVVVVVGSGSAGLESARVAALRGHRVILIEQEPHLGGTLPMAAMIKDFHEDFLGFSEWQVRQVQQLGVEIRTKTVADRALIQSLNPDAIIVAVGGAEQIPDIPGIEKRIVTTGEQLHGMLRTFTKVFSVKTLGKLSKLFLPLGKRVVVIGGTTHGVQTAHFLAARGRKVTLLEESDEIGAGMLDIGPKPRLLTWLKNVGTQFYTGVQFEEVLKNGIAIRTKDGEHLVIEADSIITALPQNRNLELYNQVKDLAPEVYAVGDCDPYVPEGEYPPLMLQPVETKTVWPSFTAAAVNQAYRVAKEI